jgi:hypothetical protein
MKRTLLTLTAVSLVLMLALAGCGKNVKRIDNERLEEEYEHAPDWVLAEYDAKMLSAVGSAHIGKGGIQFARTEALSNARGELARQVSVKVRGLVNTFAQQTGMGDDQTMDAFSKQVSKLVTDETVVRFPGKGHLDLSQRSDIYVLAVSGKCGGAGECAPAGALRLSAGQRPLAGSSKPGTATRNWTRRLKRRFPRENRKGAPKRVTWSGRPSPSQSD